MHQVNSTNSIYPWRPTEENGDESKGNSRKGSVKYSVQDTTQDFPVPNISQTL